jgi:HPt (histidine-containing phosphotransfer) domain-containing protein
MADNDRIKAKIEALRRNFIEHLPDRLEALETGLQQWRDSGQPDALRDFHRTAHSLSGAGATFDCPALSDVARELEQQLTSPELAADLARVEQLLDAVRRAIAEARRANSP